MIKGYLIVGFIVKIVSHFYYCLLEEGKEFSVKNWLRFWWDMISYAPIHHTREWLLYVAAIIFDTVVWPFSVLIIARTFLQGRKGMDELNEIADEMIKRVTKDKD